MNAGTIFLAVIALIGVVAMWIMDRRARLQEEETRKMIREQRRILNRHFESWEDLAKWLESLHDCTDGSVSNFKWTPAQIAAKAIRDSICPRPPKGWVCYGGKNHEGPCAAYLIGKNQWK